MAKNKPTFSKLKLSSDLSPKTFTWEDQTIEVKEYLPIEKKLIMIGNIINAAADENKFPNWGKIDMYKTLYIIYNYTNIAFTDKQKENEPGLYDDLVASGFYEIVRKAIPESEYEFIDYNLVETVADIYKYQNSAYGILDALNTDYSNLNFDIDKLTKDIANGENVEYLNEVLTKLG